jgi:hypothetical protein
VYKYKCNDSNYKYFLVYLSHDRKAQAIYNNDNEEGWYWYINGTSKGGSFGTIEEAARSACGCEK